MKSGRVDLLDALAPMVTRGGKLLPCAVLRLLLEGKRVSQYKPEKRERALQLLGLYAQFTQRLLDDQLLVPYEARRRRWSRDLNDRASWLNVSRLTFASARFSDEVKVPFRTWRFTHQLPRELIAAVLMWAPPVVSLPRTNGESAPVIENVLPAFIGRTVLVDTNTWCRSLATATSAKVSLTDVCSFVHQHVWPVFSRLSTAIAQSSPDSETAQLLTGKNRATVARSRKQVWAGP